MKTNFFKNMIKIDNITNGEKLALAITILVLLIVIVFSIYNVNNNEDKEEFKITYDEFSIEEVISKSTIVNDRQKYFDLYEIISNYIHSFNLELDTLLLKEDYNKIKYTREEYYLVLTEEYKKKISKSDYLNISKDFCQKFLTNTKYGEHINLDQNVIKNIYLLPSQKYGKNMYICELTTNKKDQLAYIGIHLNQTQKSYKIFYIY